MKIVTMYLPDDTSLLDIHRAAALLRCYVKPALDGKLEIRPAPGHPAKQKIFKFPSITDNTPPSAA